MADEVRGAQQSEFCLPLIKAHYPALRPSERKVADFILAHPAEVTAMSSLALARLAGVSDATVVKCSQHLGFEGFARLKMTLVRELATAPARPFGEIKPDDTIREIKDKVFQTGLQALNDTAKVLDPAALQRAAEAILAAGHVDLFGVGASGVVALDAQLKFMRIGIDCGYCQDSHAQATRATLLKPGDVAVIITYSGRTKDAIEVVNLARAAGATTICITNYPKSPAAKAAEIVLLPSAEETNLRSGALGSRLAQLTVIDCLFMAVAIHNHEQSMEYLTRTRAAVAGRKA